jgi:hypothetical protein
MTINNNLLKIGTTLTTSDLETAAGLVKRFGGEVQVFDRRKWVKLKDMISPNYYTGHHKSMSFQQILNDRFYKGDRLDGVLMEVTQENQILLSDNVCINDEIYSDFYWPLEATFGKIKSASEAGDFMICSKQYHEEGYKITGRYYPHANATLPAITAKDFDEIIEP